MIGCLGGRFRTVERVLRYRSEAVGPMKRGEFLPHISLSTIRQFYYM